MSVAFAKKMIEPGGSTRVDAQTLARAAAGDEAAAPVVLQAVGPAVLRAVRGVLGADHRDVPDLVQESFMALLRALRNFRGDCSLHQFATRIASNVAVSSLRKQGRRKETLFDDVDAAELSEAVGAADVHAAAVAGARLQMVRSSLAALPDAQAEAIALRWILGHSLAEVAAITGAPINTVRSRLRLGREALIKLLRDHPQWAELEEGGR